MDDPDPKPKSVSATNQHSVDDGNGISESDIAAEMQRSGVSREEAASMLQRPPQDTAKRITVRKSLKELISSVRQVRTQEAPALLQKAKISQQKSEPDHTIIKTVRSDLDIETTAEEQENKGRYMTRLVDTITDLDRAASSPRTALHALHELVSADRRRIIQVQLRKMKNSRDGLLLEARTLQEINDGIVVPVADQGYHRVQAIHGLTTEKARELAIHGFQPILERLMVSPAELNTTNANWLRVAATTYAAQLNDDVHIDLQSPRLRIDSNTNKAFITISIHGHNPDDEYTKKSTLAWTIQKDIHLDSILTDVEIPIHPLQSKFRWSEVSYDDVGQVEGQKMLRSREYELAKTITASLTGFLGSSASARKIVDTMLVRYTIKTVPERQPFAQVDANLNPDAIENLIPWKVIFNRGRIKIMVDPEISTLKPKKIRLPLPALETLLQVLDSMLVNLVTGSSLKEIFEAGAKTADAFAQDEEKQAVTETSPDFGIELHSDGTGVSVSRQCTSEDRHRHWHTCAGCLLGRPCSRFGEDRTEFMVCNDCANSAKTSGWKLRDVLTTPTILRTDTTKFRTVRQSLSAWMTRDLIYLGVPKNEHHAKIDEAWDSLVRIFGTGDSGQWYDIYINDSTLKEDVTRKAGWTGERYSAFAPSLEALRNTFLQNGVLHYHSVGNIGVTSVSVNRILGTNIKAALKAIRQVQLASNEEEERSAILHILICSFVRTERALNARIRKIKRKVGQRATPYLESLSRAEYEGTVPKARYVPNEIVLSPLNASQYVAQRTADWRLENYHNYLQPQIEKVADRYGFSGPGERKHWTLNNNATRYQTVPFIFSKHSVVMTWTWYTWYSWCSARLAVLKTFCDNHSNARYMDDPEARRKLNVEKFMLTMLHLYMFMLDANRRAPRKYKGQGLCALDAGGYEFIANIRNFFSLSVAHFIHGAMMATGYLGSIDFPTEHGPEFFVHERCNIRLETLLVNIARWTTNDFQELQDTVGQFAKVRVEEHDFLPDAPRPYPAGGAISITHPQFQTMTGGSITPADHNFCFSRKVRRHNDRWLAPAQVPELHTLQQADNDGADNDDEDNDSDTDSDEDSDDVDDLALLEYTAVNSPSKTNVAPIPLRGQSQALVANGKTHWLRVHAPVLQPQAANLSRDISTCFVYSPVQLLHKVFPLRIFIANAHLTDERKLFLSDKLGPEGVNLYRGALQETQSIFYLLQSHAHLGKPVDKCHVISFRDAYNSLSLAEGAHDDRGDWRRRDADANDFLIFILKQLSSITHSGSSEWELLREVLGQAHFLTAGESTMSISEDAQNVRQMYDVNAYDSDLHACYAIQCIQEQQCNEFTCEAISRTHEIMPTIIFPITPEIAAKYSEVPLEKLAFDFSHGQYDSTACRTCEKCQTGKMTSWRRRTVNDPDVVIITIQRVVSYDMRSQTTTFVPNRLMSRDINSFNPNPYLKEDLFSEGANPGSPGVSYQLVGMIMYLNSPPHYIAFVRENSDHSGAWVCFDDTQPRPRYASPFSSEFHEYVETLLVYRKIAIHLPCEECLRQKKNCLHDAHGSFDPRLCYEWLEFKRTRGVHSNGELSTQEVANVKEAARRYEDLMGFENLVQDAIFEPRQQSPDDSGLRFSDAMELFAQGPDSEKKGSFLDDDSGSDATTVVKFGPNAGPFRSSPPGRDDPESQHGFLNDAKVNTYLADALKNAYAVVDDRHAALSKREQELHNSNHQLNLNREQLQQERNEFSARSKQLDDRQRKIEEAEKDLVRRRNQLETFTEPPLTKLRTALGAITDIEAVEAMQIMQTFQLELVQHRQSSQMFVTPRVPANESSLTNSQHMAPSKQAPEASIQEQNFQHITPQHGPAPPTTSGLKYRLQNPSERIPPWLRTSESETSISKSIEQSVSTHKEAMPADSTLHRTASQRTIKSAMTADTDGDAQNRSQFDSTPRPVHDAGSDSGSMTDKHEPEVPESAKKRRRKTPMTLSPEKKRSKPSIDTAFAQDLRSPRKEADISRQGALAHSSSMASLRTGGLAHSSSMTSIKPGSLLHSASQRSLRDPRAIATPQLRQTLSSHLHTSRPSALGSKIGKVLRKASGKAALFSKRDSRPVIRSTRPETASAPHGAIRRIERMRTMDGEDQVFALRAGMPSSWEPLSKVAEEEPELVEEFMRNLRGQSESEREG